MYVVTIELQAKRSNQSIKPLISELLCVFNRAPICIMVFLRYQVSDGKVDESLPRKLPSQGFSPRNLGYQLFLMREHGFFEIFMSTFWNLEIFKISGLFSFPISWVFWPIYVVRVHLQPRWNHWKLLDFQGFIERTPHLFSRSFANRIHPNFNSTGTKRLLNADSLP